MKIKVCDIRLTKNKNLLIEGIRYKKVNDEFIPIVARITCKEYPPTLMTDVICIGTFIEIKWNEKKKQYEVK